MIIETKHLNVQHRPPVVDTEEVAPQDRVPSARHGGFGLAYWFQLILNSVPLMLADLLALAGSLGCTIAAVHWMWPDTHVGISWLFALTGVTLPMTYAAFRLYPGMGLNAVAELRQISLATILLYVIVLVFAYVEGAGTATVLTLLASSISLLVAVPLLRALARSLAAPFGWWGQPVILFGGGETAWRLYRYYTSRPRLGIRPVAIVDDWSGMIDEDPTTQTSTASQRVERLREKYGVFWAVVPTPLSATSTMAVRDPLATFPYVLIVPATEGLPIAHQQLFDCGDQPAILMTNTLLLPLPKFVKALMDYVLAVIGGLLCLPLVATIVLFVKFTSPGPVFYSQTRIGKGNQTFGAWKFRTMVVNADEVLEHYLDSDPKLREEWEKDHKLKNDPRVTTVGHWLRKTSLDELPQIWNVLRGEMSLVGPRPIVADEIPKYGHSFELYLSVTPGITGLWQVSGRNNTTYEQRVAFDSYYALNWSPWFDLYILVRTIKVVLRHEGAY